MRRTSSGYGLVLSAVFLGLFVGLGCEGPRLPGKGLSERNGTVILELNVGILNDRELPPLDEETVRKLLNAAARRVNGELPGFQIQFIFGEAPLDAQFMMSRLIRDSGPLAGRSSPEHPELILEDTEAARRLNNEKFEHWKIPEDGRRSILQAITARAAEKTRLARPLLSDRLPARDLAWRVFLNQQVRYDIVVTNAYIFPDDLKRQPTERSQRGGVTWMVTRGKGRSGLEGYVSLLSTDAPAKEGESELRAERALLGLVVPGNPELKDLRLSKRARERPDPEFLKRPRRCPVQAMFWTRRRSYFRALYYVNSGRAKEGCKLLRLFDGSYSTHYSCLGDAFYTDTERAAVMEENAKIAREHCERVGEGDPAQ